MKNEKNFIDSIDKCYKQGKLKKGTYEIFKVSHNFTNRKIESAEFFLKLLNEIEESDPSGIAGRRHKEASIYIDCEYYMLVGAIDGLFQEINSILFRSFFKQNTTLVANVMKKLESDHSDIFKKISDNWDNIKKLSQRGMISLIEKLGASI
ncbi:MAG: hypothetical protein ACTSWY_03085 [Promethearchaeota archaeon]